VHALCGSEKEREERKEKKKKEKKERTSIWELMSDCK